MTRINCGIPPSSLIDQHLIAEYRELPRILTLAIKIPRNRQEPKTFCLGKGHVTFFYDKLKYLEIRMQEIVIELSKRNYNLNRQMIASILIGFKSCPKNLYGNYSPTNEDKYLLIERISSVIQNKINNPKYYGKQRTKQQAINLLYGSIS